MKQKHWDTFIEYRIGCARISAPLSFYERCEAEKARQTYFSGSVRVDLKFNERCRTCTHSGGCYHALLRIAHYDWRTKAFAPIKLKLRHLHNSPHFRSNHSVDCAEAWKEAAKGALGFGSYWDKEYGREHGIREDSAESVSSEMDRTESGEPLLNGTEFTAYAFPGGYPIIYVSREGDVFCAKCAPRHCQEKDGFIHYEGAPEACGDCGELVDSAYGGSEDDDDSDE